jgi:hypothetical protein
VMRWVVIALLAASFLVSADGGCNTFEFYKIGYTLHDPTERHAQMIKWLERQGKLCNQEQLMVIWNNLPDWAGTADSAEIRQRVINLFSKKL